MDHAKKYLLPFFLMVFIFQIPFLVFHELYGTELLPKLPLSALTFLTPCLAASILVYRNGGAKGLWYFLGRAFDFRKIKKSLWYLPLFTFYPTIVFISYLLLRFENVSVPNVKADPLNVISLCFVFFIAGMIEEIGWTGYVTDPLQKRFGQLNAGILLGLIWAIWHWVPLIQVGRSLEWIKWWTIYTISARIIMIWFYNKTNRSVLAVSIFHMTLNVAWQLFPVNGSYFDVKMVGLLMVGAVFFMYTFCNNSISK